MTEAELVTENAPTDVATSSMDDSPIFELDLTEIQPMVALKQGCVNPLNPASGADS